MLVRVLKQLFAPKADRDTVRTAFDAGVAIFNAGDYTAATEQFARVLRADPMHLHAYLYAGLAASKGGRYREAIESFACARTLDATNSQIHSLAGEAYWKLGDNDAAWKCCESALRCTPVYPLAHELMATISLPGRYYFELLPLLHDHLRPRTYIEIGVSTGMSIALARPETRAIGIDPVPQIAKPLGARTVIHAMTSDDFFATHDVRAELNDLPIDLAFLDGMHHFEFALRDFINVEKFCTPKSTILIHDCFPLDRATSERERQTNFWSGDIWRTVLALRRYRPELEVHTIATPPTGLGIVRGLDPGSRVLQENLDEIVSEYLALDYSVLDADKAGKLARYPNDWERIKAILQ